MSLSAARLAVTIEAAFVAAGALPPLAAPLALGIANAIVNEIVANAVVLPTLLVWPGGATPAPVTGTGTLT